MKRVTLLFGDILAIDTETGALANVYGGPKYFGVPYEAYVRMERIMSNAIDEVVKIGEEAAAAGKVAAKAKK